MVNISFKESTEGGERIIAFKQPKEDQNNADDEIGTLENPGNWLKYLLAQVKVKPV